MPILFTYHTIILFYNVQLQPSDASPRRDHKPNNPIYHLSQYTNASSRELIKNLDCFLNNLNSVLFSNCHVNRWDDQKKFEVEGIFFIQERTA